MSCRYHKSIASALFLACMTAPLTGQTPLRGVNIAGAEFGEGTIPGEYGVHYTFNDEGTFAYFPERGLPLLRVPIRWERIQRQPFGELNPEYLQRLQQNVAWAREHGGRVIIDLHNYGRYKLATDGYAEFVIDNAYNNVVKVPRAALVDLWLRLSEVFTDDSAVYGYGLMNEPHDMGSADWKAISQAVVTALRDAGDDKTVFVGGDSWSSAERWQQTHGGQSWINDPADNFYYEAHLYFDQDASGRYFQGYDQELSANPNLLQIGPQRLQPFRDWCAANEVQCFLGEYGVPSNDSRWLAVLDNLLDALDDAGIGGTYWAAGHWWGSYALSVHPSGNQAKPQLAVLQQHGSPRFTMSVSAASSLDGAQAPGSLVSAYGFDLADKNTAAQLPLPVELDGVRLDLVLSEDSVRQLQLLFVSPGQINYLLPTDLPSGPAELRVIRDGDPIALEQLTIAPFKPALFAANSDGAGAPAGELVRVVGTVVQHSEPLADFDSGSGRYVPHPIQFQSEDERIIVVLYGTGFRNAPAPPDSLVLLNGQPSEAVEYIGKQESFAGLDQLNFELPRNLAGAGQVKVAVSVQGLVSNELILQLD